MRLLAIAGALVLAACSSKDEGWERSPENMGALEAVARVIESAYDKASPVGDMRTITERLSPEHAARARAIDSKEGFLLRCDTLCLTIQTAHLKKKMASGPAYAEAHAVADAVRAGDLGKVDALAGRAIALLGAL